MEIISKQKIFVLIYLTMIDKFLINTFVSFVIILSKTVTILGWIYTNDDPASGLKDIVLRV